MPPWGLLSAPNENIRDTRFPVYAIGRNIGNQATTLIKRIKRQNALRTPKTIFCKCEVSV